MGEAGGGRGRLGSMAAAVMLVGALTTGATAQETVTHPDLAQVLFTDSWTLFNRGAEVRGAGDQATVYLDARPGFGMAWFDGLEFSEGVIEVTLQGKNQPQQSFVGIAFRGQDDDTFEAIYFRPFNFVAAAPAGRAHGVQYVSHPQHTWQRLRADSPGVYEAEVAPAPDPDGPFQARIVIGADLVQVFVNGAAEPSLRVTPLGGRGKGRMGLWVGSGSDGLFSDLEVRVR